MNFIKSFILIALLQAGAAHSAPLKNHIYSNSYQPYFTFSTLPEKVYAPHGFDNNDNVQITLEGHFPSSCYQVAADAFEVSQIRNEIIIENNVTEFGGKLCLTMMVPYQKTIQFGIVSEPGKYKILFKDHHGKYYPMSTLKVEKAADLENPDNFIYAPIEKMDIVEQNQKLIIELSGQYHNPCMKKGKLKVDIQKQNDVVVLLPITQKLEPNKCRKNSKAQPFKYKLEIPQNAQPKRTLIHVRSMNGQGLNQIVNL